MDDDPELEIDVKLMNKHNRIRKRIENIYNKRAEQFETKREYDDFLEEREDIIFNLCENIGVDETEAKVRAYEAANSASIAANTARKAQEASARNQAAEDVQEKGPGAAEVPQAPKMFVPSMATGTGGQLPPMPRPVPGQNKKAVPQVASAEELKAGGWDPELPKIRKMHDAFSSLLLAPS
mmetsp:Transcript_38541/g.108983  ORF Transcript_38541/g.108983 Transcript_38541/m.108983 type:complete len:181 (-) Transcript_38541:508-1050(-)